jgi:hypothetical protein
MGFVLPIEILELPMKGKKYFSQEPCLVNSLFIHVQHILKLHPGLQVSLLQLISSISCFLELPLEPIEGRVDFMLRSSDVNKFYRILRRLIFSFFWAEVSIVSSFTRTCFLVATLVKGLLGLTLSAAMGGEKTSFFSFQASWFS